MSKAGHDLRVLIADDCEDDALLTVRALYRAGYRVSWERVDTKASMARALDDDAWDLILSDNTMPGFSGRQAVEMALAHEGTTGVPIVVVSDEEDGGEALRAGALAFVRKDHLERLAPTIERILLGQRPSDRDP